MKETKNILTLSRLSDPIILVTNIRTSFIVIVLNIFCLHITVSIIIIIIM